MPVPGHGMGILAEGHLQQRLARRGHAVIAVAEGAGVHLMGEDQARRDAVFVTAAPQFCLDQ